MDILILCGGKGTRMGQADIPKALVPIGGKPILWHIMKIYKYSGYNNFILRLGYKAHLIKEYFKNTREFNVYFVETGEDTNTGGRIKKANKLLGWHPKYDLDSGLKRTIDWYIGYFSDPRKDN